MSQVAQSISYQSASRQINGYLARPEGDGPFPGIVVIHEAFGLKENIKDITRRLADAGYIALAVDLFTGRNQALCMFRFMGGFIFNSLNNGGIHDLKAALTFLTEQPGAGEALCNLLPVQMLEPVEISNAILWLVSDAARYVTGVALPVDAGFTTK